jgi:hypothetical protein
MANGMWKSGAKWHVVLLKRFFSGGEVWRSNPESDLTKEQTKSRGLRSGATRAGDCSNPAGRVKGLAGDKVVTSQLV